MLANQLADSLLEAWVFGTDINETLPEWVRQDLHEKAAEAFKALLDALETVPIHRLDETPEAFIERFKTWYRETRNPALNPRK